MNFIVTGNTDIGLTKSTNQDSLSIKVINTKLGRMALVVLCDGMGGLDKGEVASASVIKAFDSWARNELPQLCETAIDDPTIRSQWESIVNTENEKIKAYGAGLGIRLGTTLTAMLITQNRFYVINVGDSRAYELYNGIRQITNDQTFVAREVALGNMTEEQAKIDSRRSVLLQCIGASDQVYPDMFFGDVHPNTTYMVCCDGFRNEISSDEIYDKFRPEKLFDEATMNTASLELIELDKQRRERDNITVALVRTF